MTYINKILHIGGAAANFRLGLNGIHNNRDIHICFIRGAKYVYVSLRTGNTLSF
jgi:hypothetical protein